MIYFKIWMIGVIISFIIFSWLAHAATALNSQEGKPLSEHKFALSLIWPIVCIMLLYDFCDFVVASIFGYDK